jgi:hypothetical protein
MRNRNAPCSFKKGAKYNKQQHDELLYRSSRTQDRRGQENWEPCSLGAGVLSKIAKSMENLVSPRFMFMSMPRLRYLDLRDKASGGGGG